MNEADTQALGELMRHVVYPKLDTPDLAMLNQVSEPDLKEFAEAY